MRNSADSHRPETQKASERVHSVSKALISTSLRPTLRFLLILTAAVLLSHTASAIVLSGFRFSPTTAEFVLKPVMVAGISFLLLHFFVLRPLLRRVKTHEQAERDLKTHVEFKDAIIDNTSIGILTYNSSAHCIQANHTAAQLTGCTKEDLLRQNFIQLDSWRSSGLLEAAHETWQTGSPSEGEFRFASAWGQKMRGYFRLVPFTCGNQHYLLALIDDICERKQVEPLRQRAASLERHFYSNSNLNIEIQAYEYVP